MARKRLLIPLDGSAVSRQVLPVVRQVVDPASYAITLLRVAEEPAGFVGPPPQFVPFDHTVVPLPRSSAAATRAEHPIYQSQTEATLRDALEDELRADAHDVAADGFDVAVDVRFGVPAEEILAAVHEAPFDLVAMTTHGRSGLRRLVLGSVADAVLRRAEVPVLLVRAGARVDDEASSSPAV